MARSSSGRSEGARLRQLQFLLSVALNALVAPDAVAQVAEPKPRLPGAIVSGVVHDSIARAPLAGAWVQLVAADKQAHAARTVLSDSMGRFLIDDVPDGRYNVGFYHPMLDSLGVEPPPRSLQVKRHRAVRADLAIPSPAQLRAAVCGRRQTPAARTGGVVLGVVRDARERVPVAGVTVIGEWLELTIRKGGVDPLRVRISTTTDTNGWFALCHVPSGGTMALGVVRGADSTRLMEVLVPVSGVRRSDLYVGSARSVAAGDSSRLSLTLGLPPVPTEAMIRAGVDSATREFLATWRVAWQETQRPRFEWTNVERDDELRILSLHCHWVGSDPQLRYSGSDPRIRQHLITGSVTAHASCPKWYAAGRATIDDERRGIDGGLAARARAGIGALRSLLRALLDSAAQRLPGDVQLAGQRVRFALDARDGAGAKAAACTRDDAHCGLLRGLVLYHAGDVAGADSTFLASARLMRDDERCAWNDVGALLEKEPRNSYGAMECAARAELEERLWWLADPLYLEPGNERRAEHFARKVLVTLLAPLGFDGRQHWEQKQGGEAVAETLIRYGWPSQMYWGGPDADRGHDEWLIVRAADAATPYVAREYTRGRLHTVPRSLALQTPLRVTDADWQINAPAGDDDWWPVEHFARDRSRIVQLPVGQRVMLRRRDAVRFVWAGDLDSVVLARRSGEHIRATAFQSRAASAVESVGTFVGRIGSPLVINTPLHQGASLIGIELPGDSARPAARTRFGVDALEPLTALAAGKALSQPLLFEPSGDPNLRLDADAAARRMYGTTTFTKWRRIGVYWESYGFAADDAVELELRMSREDRPGVFASIVSVFRIGREEGGTVSMKWREEPGSGGAIHRREGDVLVQMRSIVLDISRLAHGTYRLQLSVKKAGEAAVTSEREFVLR